MADSFVQVPADGAGKQIDTRTEATNGNHRQVIVIGDPTTNADIAVVTAANGLQVNLVNTQANATAIKVDNSAVTQPVSGTLTVQQSTAANLKVDLSGTAANATAIKVDGSAVTQPVSRAVPTSGGYSNSHLVTAGSTNATNVKASAGQLYGITVYSNAAYPVYVKFHNNAGTPTAGAGVVQTLGCQAGVLNNMSWPDGIAFSTGIAFTVVKGIADSDSTAVLANDAVIDIQYK